MRKLTLIALLLAFLASCSKKEVIISGKITNASPTDRIELIETSNVAAMPIVNIGLDEKGNFADTLTVEKEGVYALTYGGKMNFVYLKGGQNFSISGDGASFPENIKFDGEGKANNEFLVESQKATQDLLSKLDFSIVQKDETAFLAELKKFQTEVFKKIDDIAKTKKADSKVIDWKKGEFEVTLLAISVQYEQMHGQITNNPNFKTSQKFKDFQKDLEKDSHIKDFPTYRNYIFSKYEKDFQKFLEKEKNPESISYTDAFARFAENKKEISQQEKDYLLAFIASSELSPRNPNHEKVIKAFDKIKDAEIKADLLKATETIFGIKVGTPAPETELVKQDGKKGTIAEFKGKPTLVLFYSSWNPYIAENVVPILKEINGHYKAKMNFALINMDDTSAHFQKATKGFMNGISGVHLYAKGGLQSDAAKKYSIYSFKLPSFVVLDKEGKIASKVFYNIMDPEFIEVLNKQSGIQMPTAVPTPELTPMPAAGAEVEQPNKK